MPRQQSTVIKMKGIDSVIPICESLKASGNRTWCLSMEALLAEYHTWCLSVKPLWIEQDTSSFECGCSPGGAQYLVFECGSTPGRAQ